MRVDLRVLECKGAFMRPPHQSLLWGLWLRNFKFSLPPFNCFNSENKLFGQIFSFIFLRMAIF